MAPTVPRLLNICPANNGNAAANDERTKAFAAITVAAMGLYADTRYVKVELKHNKKPAPKNPEAMMGAIQWT